MKSDQRIARILDAAEEIMSQKGLVGTSIAEIAKKAEVADSLIYSFFKGKEDVLFSMTGRRMQIVLKDLSAQLEGILDPASKLSKMIWFHLTFNDANPWYARLLLLECRSNPKFYKHESYKLVKDYAKIMTDILEEGVEKGIFLQDVNMKLVRDIIFGLLDWEMLGVLASGEIENSAQDFKDILALVFPMISSPKEPPEDNLDKKFRILLAAETAFAEKGFIQATIADISRLAQVSEGSIYEYFKNKEELLLSILEQRFREHLASLDEIFEIRTPLKKLRRLIRYHFFLYLTQPNFVKVFLLHAQLNKNFYTSPAYKVFQDYCRMITETLDDGKNDGTLRADINNRIFRYLFLGTFSHMAMRWSILGERESNKMEEIDDAVMLLCRAVSHTAPFQ